MILTKELFQNREIRSQPSPAGAGSLLTGTEDLIRVHRHQTPHPLDILTAPGLGCEHDATMDEMSGRGSSGLIRWIRSKANHNAADAEIVLANNAVEPRKS